MKKHFLFFIVLFVSTNFICAQNMERVRSYLDTLCSSSLHGRGAGFDGQKKAAVYLADRFSEIGLLPLSNSYYQTFNYTINTFPGKLNLQIDQVTLIPGKDYIIEAGSPSGKATLKIVIADTLIFVSDKKKKKFLNSDFQNTALVCDERFSKLLKTKPPEFQKKIDEASCVVELKEKKLTMGLSSKQNEKPVFEVLKEKFNWKAKTLSFEIEAVLLKNYEAQNVCGYVKGTTVPDSFLFITAHYDHLGTLGKAIYFPGANDNGSGVSMLLELARYFKENPARYSIVFIAFGAEEAGLIGSKYFTENPLVPLAKIRFLINLDLMGTGDDGMMVVNGSVFEKEFETLAKINTDRLYLTAIKKRGKAANSDHFFFTEKGVPAFFFYTLGGITAYHDVNDLPQTLPLTKFREVYRLITEFVGMLDQ
jgi:aminopeptidase YwaD